MLGGEDNQLVSRQARHSVRDTGSVTERASVSGGTLMMGSYLITAWSTDQASAPARSSDEAELYDTNEATSEDWDLRHLRVIAVFNRVSRWSFLTARQKGPRGGRSTLGTVQVQIWE